jgi:hypothetical protein
MEATKPGRYLRPEHDPDDDLREIGVSITDRTKETPVDAEYQVEDETSEESGITWGDLKKPVLFLALTIGIAVCEHLGLMAEVIAMPSMCVCAACFGWSVKR